MVKIEDAFEYKYEFNNYKKFANTKLKKNNKLNNFKITKLSNKQRRIVQKILKRQTEKNAIKHSNNINNKIRTKSRNKERDEKHLLISFNESIFCQDTYNKNKLKYYKYYYKQKYLLDIYIYYSLIEIITKIILRITNLLTSLYVIF